MEATAAQLVAYDRPLEVHPVTLPEPTDGQVVVDMAYAAVNPVDRVTALGRVDGDQPLPRTIGMEGVGRVDGRLVLLRGGGLWSTSVVADADALIPVPEGVHPVAASAMGVAGVTAWRTVTELARVADTDRVLVLGASGGVGAIIVSVVRALGATVWGQTSSDEAAAWVRQRGVDQVVVCEADELADRVADLAPTVVFDPLGGAFTGQAVDALAEHGRLVIFGTSAGDRGTVPLQALYGKGLTLYGFGGLIEPPEEMAAAAHQALEALAAARLEVAVDAVVPLAEVNEAFERLDRHDVRGKLVLDLS